MDILERFKEIISISEKPFVLEFGACDGYHSRIMIDMLNATGKKYTYHLFEPNKDLLHLITDKLPEINTKQVYLINQAIGAENGNFPFYKSGGEEVENGKVLARYFGSSSIRKPKLVIEAWTQMTFEELTADITTLDSHIILAEEQGRIIDFIWADIQGAEVDLINGGKETFKNVRYLYTEYANAEFYEGEISREQILELLPDFEMIEDYGGDILLKNKNL